MLCLVCQKQGEKFNVCSKCGCVVYCGKVIYQLDSLVTTHYSPLHIRSLQECQRRDWPRHKAECRTQVLKLARVEGRGVSVTATKNIAAGTKIFEVQAWILCLCLKCELFRKSRYC